MLIKRTKVFSDNLKMLTKRNIQYGGNLMAVENTNHITEKQRISSLSNIKLYKINSSCFCVNILFKLSARIETLSYQVLHTNKIKFKIKIITLKTCGKWYTKIAKLFDGFKLMTKIFITGRVCDA